MKKKNPIHLLDVTLREGSYVADFEIKSSDVAHLVDYLDHAGVEFIEIGHGSGLGAARLGYPSAADDREYFEAARPAAKKTKLGGLVNPEWSNLPDFDELHSLMDFARIGVNIHETPRAARMVDRSKGYGLFTFVQLMRTPAFPPFKAAVTARKAEKMGADVIYIVDTMGSLTPKTVKEYVKAFKDHVGVPLGFHSHNNLGLATANCIEAARAGCRFIDGSILGVGRQAGNAQLETLALLLGREGFHTPIDIPFLLDTAESLVTPLFPNHHGIDPFDLYAAYWNLDLYPPWAYKQMAMVLGLNTKALIEEIAQLKNFIVLDENHLAVLAKKFDVPFDKLTAAVRNPPDRIKAKSR